MFVSTCISSLVVLKFGSKGMIKSDVTFSFVSSTFWGRILGNFVCFSCIWLLFSFGRLSSGKSSEHVSWFLIHLTLVFPFFFLFLFQYIYSLCVDWFIISKGKRFVINGFTTISVLSAFASSSSNSFFILPVFVHFALTQWSWIAFGELKNCLHVVQ